MAKIQFTVLYDANLYGPFPKRELEQLDGISVSMKGTEKSFEFEVTLYVDTPDKDMFSAIYVIGMYTTSIIHRNKGIQLN
jgi:hypothetical protein